MGTDTCHPTYTRLGCSLPRFALLALATGCGGDDSTSATESSTTVDLPTGELTKSELATEADALCADATDRIMNDADPPEFGDDGPQPEEVEASAPFWSATVEEQASSSISSVGAPAARRSAEAVG